MAQTTLKQMTRRQQPKFGHYVGEFLTPGIGHILASAHCEFVFFDLEHSGFGIESLKSALRYFEAAGIRAIIRSPSRDYDMIARICDAGAEGIMVPMVKDAEDAATIVRHMKYAPQGKRGVILGTAHDNYYNGDLSIARRLEQANERTTFFPLIETRQGVGNVFEIAATPGVDCLWLGHFDLSTSLGIPGEFEHPDFLAAVERIIEAGKANELALGRLVGSVPEARRALQQGFDFCCYGIDSALYQNALAAGIREIKNSGE